jgi:DNA-binding HxlR family transcriptional regulator
LIECLTPREGLWSPNPDYTAKELARRALAFAVSFQGWTHCRDEGLNALVVDMVFAGKRTFNQLLDSDEGIATNVLRDRLNSLIERGLLTKSDDPERKGRTRYALTERAITLVPVLVHLGHRGERWLSADPDLRRKNRRLFTGGPVLWEKIMDELRA